MDELSTNVINLRARVALLQSQAVADEVGAAIAELEDLRTSLRNLNLVLQLHYLAGRPLADEDSTRRMLDEIAHELADYIQNFPTA